MKFKRLSSQSAAEAPIRAQSGGCATERGSELAPVIEQVHVKRRDRLHSEHEEWLYGHRIKILAAEHLGHHAPTLTEAKTQLRRSSFEAILDLAASFSYEEYECVFDAVFEFEEYSVAPGAPDILVT